MMKTALFDQFAHLLEQTASRRLIQCACGVIEKEQALQRLANARQAVIPVSDRSLSALRLDMPALGRDAIKGRMRYLDGSALMGDVENRIGLVEFLTDLRAELSEAQSRAAKDSLKLAVEEISLTLDVAYTLTRNVEASGTVKAKFWVFASAEASAKGTQSAERARTQQLTLTLKPRLEQTIIDEQGQQTTITRDVDVEGDFAAGEERPTIPVPEAS
ncbi:MAG: hypothetical protein JWQ97_3872 [Phenylobacterium sp.]|nr:hypothetical protein [Phenylobacterium sp.]